jgi:hypothetical protein
MGCLEAEHDMSNSIADLTSRPVKLRVAVKDDAGEPTGEVLEYTIYPLTFADQGNLQRWVDEQFPDPFDAAWEAINRAKVAGKPFNVAQEQFMLKNAAELAMNPRHLIGTPAADMLLFSEEGLKRIMIEGIRKGDSSFDEAAADRLLKHMDPGDAARVYGITQMNLVLNDPKAEPLDVKGSSRQTGASASRQTRRAAKARNGGPSGTV